MKSSKWMGLGIIVWGTLLHAEAATDIRKTKKAPPAPARPAAELDRSTAPAPVTEINRDSATVTESKREADVQAAETRADAQVEATRVKSEADRDAMKTRSDARVEAAESKTEGKSEGTFSSPRLNDRFGAYASLWGDPFPTTIGVNLAYNVYDFVRVNLGVGADNEDRVTVDTIGAGVKFLVPGWSLTPVLGANFSNTSQAAGGRRTVRGFDPSGSRFYGTAGIDWQTGMGLAFAVGWAESFRSGEDGNAYINAGIFL